MTRIPLAIVLISLTLSGFTRAKPPVVQHIEHGHFFNLSKKSGLPSGLVLDILQDQKGFIWIATDNGLSRYDGDTFLNFQHNPDDSLSIPHNFVSSLTLSSDNRLYIATHAGLCRYNRGTTTFERLPKYGNAPIGHHILRKILIQGTDTLFIENANGIFNRYIIPKQQIDHHFHAPPSQPYYHYHCLRADRDGDIWMGGRMTGLYQYLPESNQLIRVEPVNSDSTSRQPDVTDFFQDSKGRYWLASINGFYQYNKTTGVLDKRLSTSTFSICEDKEDNIWLGLGYGLAKYDPEKNTFSIYRNHPSDPFSLADDYVNRVMCDQQGNIWAATRNGISVLSTDRHYTVFLRHLPGKSNTLSHNYVSSLAEDNHQKVWIGTLGGGLNKWDIKTGSITHIQHESGNNGIASNNIKTLYIDPKTNKLWVGLWEGVGFNRLDTQTEKTDHFRINPHSTHSDWYNSFLRDSQGRFWLGIWGFNGMVRYNPETRTLLPPNLRNDSEPFNKTINALAFDGHNIWLGTQPSLLYAYRNQLKDYKVFYGQPSPAGALTDNAILADYKYYDKLVAMAVNNHSVLVVTNKDLIQTRRNKDTLHCQTFRPEKGIDLPQSVWGATSGTSVNSWFLITSRGIEHINFDNNTISILIEKKQIATNPLTSIARTPEQLIVTTSKEIFHLTLADNKLTKPTLQPGIPDSEAIQKIHLINKDTIILQTSGGMAIKTLHENWRWVNLRGYYHKGFLANTLLSLLPDTANSLWLGTENGLYRMTRHNQDTVFSTYPKLTRRQILSLTYGPERELWVGTDSGPAKIVFPYGPGDVTMLNNPPQNRLTSHLIKFLFEDSNRNLWAGTTNAGVNLIHPQTFRIKHFPDSYPDSTGFWGHSASCILESENGLIWIGGNGLNCYNPLNGRFTHYTVADGLPRQSIQTVCEDDSGYLWIGFDNGLGKYDPWQKLYKPAPLERYQVPPQTAFTTSLKLSNGQLIFGGPDGLIRFDPDNFIKNTSQRKTYISGLYIHGQPKKVEFEPGEVINLNHDDNFISITFSNLFYPPDGQTFRYRMKNLDSDWNILAGNQLSYNGIPPGRYTLEVGNLNAPTTSLSIVIHPPFWRTWWFTLLWIIALAGMMAWIFYQQIHKLHLNNKSIELEQRLLRSQMNPHFVFNLLSAIQSFIFSNEPVEAGRYLSKFAKLMRLTLQNSREPFIPLTKELEALRFYLELQQLRWNNFDYEIITNNIDCNQVAIPPMMVQPFAENSIEHGFNALNGKGLIQIKFTIFMSEMHIHIRDNGIGINSSLKTNKKDKSHQSLASVIANERLAMLNRGKFLYQLTIQDCSDIHPQETGTLVTISLPFKRIKE